MKIQFHRIDTNVVVGLLVREFCCSGTDVSAKVLAMYADTRTPSMEPQWLATGLSQQFIFGGIVMVILGLIMGGRITHVSVNAMLMLFYLACISAVAYSIWGILLKYNPVSKVAIFGFTNPVFGVLLSAWWLREGSKELGINVLIALVLVCIGISIVNINKAAEK